jgi:hypothetical protein
MKLQRVPRPGGKWSGMCGSSSPGYSTAWHLSGPFFFRQLLLLSLGGEFLGASGINAYFNMETSQQHVLHTLYLQHVADSVHGMMFSSKSCFSILALLTKRYLQIMTHDKNRSPDEEAIEWMYEYSIQEIYLQCW